MENDFAKPLAAYWARLESTVHPDDVPIMDAAPREINFDFPPPAFIGDILHAKVFVLVGNGGYDCRLTPKEFAAAGSAELYRRRLAEPFCC